MTEHVDGPLEPDSPEDARLAPNGHRPGQPTVADRPINGSVPDLRRARRVREGLARGKKLDEIKAIRRDEAERAAAELGADVRLSDAGDYPLLPATELVGRLVALYRVTQSDVVLTHPLDDPYNFSVARLLGRPRQGAEEHPAIVRTVVAAKPDEAEREMRSHLQSVIGALYELQEQGALYTIPASSAAPAR